MPNKITISEGRTFSRSRLVDCLSSYHNTRSQQNRERAKKETTTTHLRIRNRTENVEEPRNTRQSACCSGSYEDLGESL